jgi:type IV pilus assembly protein PilC
MPTFQYTAKDATGVTWTGTLEADDERIAAELLREQGQWPIRIEHRRAPQQPLGRTLFDALFAPLMARVRLMELVVFYREMATLINAGMTVFRALSIMAEQTHSGRLRAILLEMLPDSERGTPLSDLMARYPTTFSDLAVAMVRAGEAGGTLDLMLSRLADYHEREQELRHQIRWKVMYLKAVLVVFLLVSAVVAVCVKSIQGRGSLSAPAFAGALLINSVPLLLILAVLAALRIGLAVSLPLRRAYDAIKLYVPVIGGLVRQLACARFSRALASLYSAGMQMGQALEAAAPVAGNQVMTDQIQRLIPSVQKGRPLSEALQSTGHFPSMVVQMVHVGEETGDLDGMLNKVAGYYESHAASATQSLITVGFVLLIIAFGIAVLIFAKGAISSIYGPFLSFDQ